MAYNPQQVDDPKQNANNQAARLEIDRLQAQITALQAQIKALQASK